MNTGDTIGIFPEGGSHDRTELLPLKAGVAVMALGAMSTSGIPIKIVPFGLSYFSGHRFRSSSSLRLGSSCQHVSGVKLSLSLAMLSKYLMTYWFSTKPTDKKPVPNCCRWWSKVCCENVIPVPQQARVPLLQFNPGSGLRSVTINAKDYTTLRVISIARRMYQPANVV